jgi:hypothetical protein
MEMDMYVTIHLNKAVHELLNTMRTEALGTNRQLLDVADSLENLFKNQERDLDTTHRMLGQTQSKLDQELLRADKFQNLLEKKDRHSEGFHFPHRC